MRSTTDQVETIQVENDGVRLSVAPQNRGKLRVRAHTASQVIIKEKKVNIDNLFSNSAHPLW